MARRVEKPDGARLLCAGGVPLQGGRQKLTAMHDLRKWPCALFWLCVLVLYSHWTWTDLLNDFGGDSAEYLLLAQHWSWVGIDNPTAAQFASASSFPPLFPILLGLFAAGQNWLLAHQLVALCGVATLFVMWRQLRIEDIPLEDSLLSVALVALVPGFYSQALYIHSELLFLLFVSLTLYAVSRLESENKAVFTMVAALAAAGAYLTRSAGLALVVALFVYVLLHRPKREWAIVATCGVLPVLLWMYFGQPPGGGYLAAWRERLALVGLQGISSIAYLQLLSLADGHFENFTGQGSNNYAAVLVFSALCVAAWLRRLCQGKLDALFLGAYFAILIAWPFPAERVRFTMPLIPILVTQLLLAIRVPGVFRAVPHAALAGRLAMLVLAIALLPTLLLFAQRYAEPMPVELENYRRIPQWYSDAGRDERLSTVALLNRLQTGFKEIAEFVPTQECVYSIKPSLVALFAHRNSLRPPLPGSKPGLQLDVSTIECRYVHMSPLISPTFPVAYYPRETWAPNMELLHVTWLVPADETRGVAGLIAKVP